MNKSSAVIVLAASLCLAGAGAAQATVTPSPYPAEQNQGTVSDGTIAPGETVIFSGTGFIPGEIIDITVDFVAGDPSAAARSTGPVGAAARGGLIARTVIILTDTVTADADGNFSWPVTLHDEGVYTLTAVGRESGHTVTARVVVDLPNATTAADSNLANTGADSAMLLWGAAGLGALGLGAASVVIARRRSAEA